MQSPSYDQRFLLERGADTVPFRLTRSMQVRIPSYLGTWHACALLCGSRPWSMGTRLFDSLIHG